MVLSTVGSLSQVSTSLITDSSPLSPQDILIDPNCHDGNCNDDDDDDDDGDDGCDDDNNDDDDDQNEYCVLGQIFPKGGECARECPS